MRIQFLVALLLAYPAFLTEPSAGATIDISGYVSGETYTGTSLQNATALNLNWPTEFIYGTPGVSGFVFLSPLTFGSGSAPFTFSTAGGPVFFGNGMLPSASDDGAQWYIGSDYFVEALTAVSYIDRSANGISVGFTGFVNDSFGIYVDAAATANFTATDDLGNGRIGVPMSFDPAVSSDIPYVAPVNAATDVPEGSTLALLATGFVSMIWLAKRRRNTQRLAID